MMALNNVIKKRISGSFYYCGIRMKNE